MPLGLSVNEFPIIKAKTAAYQVLTSDHGVFFTNEGAGGSVTFTLPPVTSPTLPPGWNCRFYVAADQSIVVASSGSLDNIYAFNDAAADSVAFSTSAEKVGNCLEVLWTGTGWASIVSLAAETVTPTIA